MDIIIRQVLGGFCACFDDGKKKFAKRGKSKGEAIANLILKNRRQFCIRQVKWDRNHAWTSNYLAGKPNRRVKMPKMKLIFSGLPVVSSPKEACQLVIEDLNLPRKLKEALLGAFEYWNRRENPLRLGEVCELTLSQLKAKESRRSRFGEKKFQLLNQLLKHYGLEMKKEAQ